MSKNIQDVLVERGNNYGNFHKGATIVQNLKLIAHHSELWPELAPDMKEAIEMIFHKIARIINGNHSYEDSWRDCAGYATLVADRLHNEQVAQLIKDKCYVHEFNSGPYSVEDITLAAQKEYTEKMEEAKRARLIK